jgi:hypothetical protein
LLRLFFLPYLIIDRCRATLAARSAVDFMLMRATSSSAPMRSRKRLGDPLLRQLAMIALRIPTDPSGCEVIAKLEIGGTRDASLYRSRWQSTENSEAIALEDLHAGIHRPTLFRSVFAPERVRVWLSYWPDRRSHANWVAFPVDTARFAPTSRLREIPPSDQRSH